MKGIVAWFRCFCIAEHQIACRQGRRCAWLLLAAAVWSVPLQAQDPQSAYATASPLAAPAHATSLAPQGPSVLRARGRLRAAEMGLVINSADPCSVVVGAHCIQPRSGSSLLVIAR
jgi:hypothetical protein